MSDNAETEILVYNKDFKTRNIVENIDGVFTLGEATIEDINRLNNMKEKYEAQRQEHQTQKNALEVKEKERDSLDEKFRDIVWEEILKKNEKDFMEAFTGYRSNKEKFHKLVLEKYREYNELTKKDLISTRDNLIARANVLFSTDLKTCEPINVSFADKILHAQQIETDQVWSEIVVGNKDLPISKLINSLQNADWVNKGRSFLRGSKTCPFCQNETITDDFAEQLNSFFSGEYEAKIEMIRDLMNEYREIIRHVKGSITEIVSNELFVEIGEIDKTLLSSLSSTLETIFNSNGTLISNKEQEPGSKIKLSSSNLVFNQIVEIINNANKSIDNNNALIANKEVEKKKLMNDIWMFLMKENSSLIAGQLKDKSDCEKGIEGIRQKISAISNELEVKNKEIVEAGKSITSVQPTVDEINRLLKAYGFTNFKIVPSKKYENSYQIQRPDGTLATDTLSEGEETFISFIYFLQFAKGSVDRNKVSSKKIMVLDDPISSLDSTILYVASSMVKSLIKNIRKGESDVKQLFVLTHNVFFHKETSYISRRNDEFKDINYWILSKNDSISSIKSFGMKNPIKTSYELLWQELRDDIKISLVTVQNTMRRILEYYFGILGKEKDDTIEKLFESVEEQIICRSLFSWINDGSHSIPDDIHIDSYSDSVSRYKAVFKDIFKIMGHEAHYNMMMRIEDKQKS